MIGIESNGIANNEKTMPIKNIAKSIPTGVAITKTISDMQISAIFSSDFFRFLIIATLYFNGIHKLVYMACTQ